MTQIDIGGQILRVKTWPVRCVDLHAGDSIIMGATDTKPGKLLTIDAIDDELTAYDQRVLRDSENRPVYLNADAQVEATELQRRFILPCMACQEDTPVDLNVVEHGKPTSTICGPCSSKHTGTTKDTQLIITVG